MLFQKYDFCLNSVASAEFIPAQQPQRHCVVRFNPQTGHSKDCKDCLAVRFKGWTEGVRLLNNSRGCHYCWSLFRQRKNQIPNETDSLRLWPSERCCVLNLICLSLLAWGKGGFTPWTRASFIPIIIHVDIDRHVSFHLYPNNLITEVDLRFIKTRSGIVEPVKLKMV